MSLNWNKCCNIFASIKGRNLRKYDLKTEDIVDVQNLLLCHSFLNGKLPQSFENFFQKSSDTNLNNTRACSSDSLYLARFKSTTYGARSLTSVCIRSWNDLRKTIDTPSSMSLAELKKKLFELYLDQY